MNLAGKVTWALSLIGATALGVAGTSFFAAKSKVPESTVAPLIALEKIGYLASLKVSYADVIEFTEKRARDIPWTQWDLRFGGTSVVLVARGDCTVGIDLRAAKYGNVNADERTLTVEMPEPRALVARVNHEAKDKGGSYFYAISNRGLETVIPDTSNRIRAINNALALAETEIRRVCSHPEAIATAKRNAEDVLTPTFQAVGWKANFTWNEMVK